MPTYQFEALDRSGQEIRDVLDAASEEEAQVTIQKMGYFITKISVKKVKKAAAKKGSDGRKRAMAIGGVKPKLLTTFTRQLSILQDAGLPILRSLKILEGQQPPGRLKNSLMDTCDDIEAGSTLSEAMAKSPKAFDRLYVNMIKAGEAGGALETILRRLAEFQERSLSLRRKIKSALVYPVVVVMVAVGILTFIMIAIVPKFIAIFDDFGVTLPTMTVVLVKISHACVNYWWGIPAIPISIWLTVKLIRKFKAGRFGWDLFTLKMPIFGPLVEKSILARTTRTLGTLVSSGVPILEGLNITRETAGNSMFEMMFTKITEQIREGESIAKPMKEYSKCKFHPWAAFFWFFIPPVIGLLIYLTRMNAKVVDDLVVNMVDVGEETGELDTMLYKVADTYDEEVEVLTETLMSLMEPLLIIFLGGAVGFIVIALFMPLVKLITALSGEETRLGHPARHGGRYRTRPARKRNRIMNAGKNRRGGFTLVEMLVVMAIIAILAGLITAAAANAMWAAKQTKIKVEVDMLAGAMESFKQKYGLYPPANLYCTGYQDAGGHPSVNPQLLAFVARAFPRYAIVSGTSPGNQIFIDLSNLGVDLTHFNPQGALVFWLSGFSPDPTDPFNRQNQSVSRTPFFTFDQTRLVTNGTTSGGTAGSPGAVSVTGTAYALGAATNTGAANSSLGTPTYGVGQLIYNAPYGTTAYCYFDYQSYGTLVNTSAGTIGNVAGTAAANFGTVYAASLSTVPSPLAEYLSASNGIYAATSNGTGYVMPYVLDVNNNNMFDIADTFCSPTSFQIISAGQDGAFGTSVGPNPALQGRLYPSGLNTNTTSGATIAQGISYDPPPPNGGSADDDNVTNFCAKSSLGSAKP